MTREFYGEHEDIHCPYCEELGSYQGIGSEGDNWTGTSFAVQYCSECNVSWRMPRTWAASP